MLRTGRKEKAKRWKKWVKFLVNGIQKTLKYKI
jgi:hypothetical protein